MNTNFSKNENENNDQFDFRPDDFQSSDASHGLARPNQNSGLEVRNAHPDSQTSNKVNENLNRAAEVVADKAKVVADKIVVAAQNYNYNILLNHIKALFSRRPSSILSSARFDYFNIVLLTVLPFIFLSLFTYNTYDKLTIGAVSYLGNSFTLWLAFFLEQIIIFLVNVGVLRVVYLIYGVKIDFYSLIDRTVKITFPISFISIFAFIISYIYPLFAIMILAAATLASAILFFIEILNVASQSSRDTDLFVAAFSATVLALVLYGITKVIVIYNVISSLNLNNLHF